MKVYLGAFCSHVLGRIFTLNGKEWHLWRLNNFTSGSILYNIEIVVVSTLGPDATAVISPSSSISTARVQLGHYAENHGEHYICVESTVLLEEEEEEVKDYEQEKSAEEEVEDDEQGKRAKGGGRWRGFVTN